MFGMTLFRVRETLFACRDETRASQTRAEKKKTQNFSNQWCHCEWVKTRETICFATQRILYTVHAWERKGNFGANWRTGSTNTVRCRFPVLNDTGERESTLNFFYLHHLYICFPTWYHGDSPPLTFSRLSFLLLLAERSESLSQLHRQKMFYPCRRCRAVTPEASICLSIPCPSETQLDYHNGLWKLHMEQCFFRNKSGVCDSTAGPFY